ncbi:GTPase HflX [Halomarina oriensis]|uniref:GTPase HflX n=1 Tax=Halomarina oriensis TaxID=671145 RepID=A0A6B0GFX7_9EURY|nr:GTPase HflX [Halomarina oriensis]MWG32937.1 GTPase HflX [Halomarina oriensis]
MQSRHSPQGGTAVVAARHTDEPDTTEIRRLADAAGYEVVAEHTQRTPEDAGYAMGRGKVERVAATAADHDADAVVYDGGLTPGQYSNWVELLPPGTDLLDRYRLVLGIFAEGAADRAAQLQVELATLRYRLPRLRQVTEESLLNRATEKGSVVLDVEDRIDRLHDELRAVSDRAERRRVERRERGFDPVAIAGYTNAGKSTLLHRLADDLSVGALDEGHPDLDETAAVEDRLFETLETTTRRATIGGRRVLLTDTVGLVDALPHDLVASFSATLDAVADADVGLLVVDASDTLDEVREKRRVSLAELDDPRCELLVVLNKCDLLTEEELAARREDVAELDRVDDVLAVSAVEGTGVETLRDRIGDALPGETLRAELPNGGETESFLAWAHDHGTVTDREYTGETIRFGFEARPGVVERARSRVDDLREGTADRSS